MGEVDSFIIYPEPDVRVFKKLRENKTRTELWNNLPTELGYNKQGSIPFFRAEDITNNDSGAAAETVEIDKLRDRG